MSRRAKPLVDGGGTARRMEKLSIVATQKITLCVLLWLVCISRSQIFGAYFSFECDEVHLTVHAATIWHVKADACWRLQSTPS